MLGQNVDSPATGQTPSRRGFPWVGYDSDSSKFGSEVVADGFGLQLGPVLPRARQGRDGGHLEDGVLLRSIKDGFTGLAPFGPGVRRRRSCDRAKQKAIESGKFHEFEGPLYDQKGKLCVAKGGRAILKGARTASTG